jgi:hypothetical protein
MRRSWLNIRYARSKLEMHMRFEHSSHLGCYAVSTGKWLPVLQEGCNYLLAEMVHHRRLEYSSALPWEPQILHHEKCNCNIQMEEATWKICMHKTYLREIGCEGVNWVEIIHSRYQWKAFMNMMMNIFLKNAGKFFFL